MKRLRLPYFQARFTLEGLNLERFLRLAAEKGVPLLSVTREGPRRMACECHEADLPALRAMIEEKGWKCTRVEPLFLSAARAYLKRRWGLPVGFALMLVAALTLYQFIWAVDVVGAGAYRGDMAAFLAQERIAVGTPKRDVDVAVLERKLYRRYPRVAWFSVYVRDVTLTVECALGAPLPEALSAAPGDIVASRDGLVSALEVYAGTAAVKAGDLVRAGQTLILGQERIADGQTVPVRAEGRVLARCWVSRSAAVSALETLSTPTGRATETCRLRSPWLSWPQEDQSPSYLASEKEIERVPLVGCFFPVWRERVVHREVALEYAPRDPEAVRAEAEEAALRKLALAVPSDETVDKWVDYCMIEGDSCTATATAETVVNIAQAAISPP